MIGFMVTQREARVALAALSSHDWKGTVPHVESNIFNFDAADAPQIVVLASKALREHDLPDVDVTALQVFLNRMRKSAGRYVSADIPVIDLKSVDIGLDLAREEVSTEILHANACVTGEHIAIAN